MSPVPSDSIHGHCLTNGNRHGVRSRESFSNALVVPHDSVGHVTPNLVGGANSSLYTPSVFIRLSRSSSCPGVLGEVAGEPYWVVNEGRDVCKHLPQFLRQGVPTGAASSSSGE